MISELVRATVAEPQVLSREAEDERRGRQTCVLRNTNIQRGRLRAARVLANSKPNPHKDAVCKGWGNAGKVQSLTRGDLRRESVEEVSRGRSRRRRARGQRARLTIETVNPAITKGQSIGTMAYLKALAPRRKDSSTREAACKAKIPDDPSDPKGKPVKDVMGRKSSQGARRKGGRQS
jgi:hypothetical protein